MTQGHEVTTAVAHEGSALADALVRRIGQTVGDRAGAAAVFGEPVVRDGVTVIPVARARFGFGGGGGAGGPAGAEGSGGGGGGGAWVSPAGYIEVRDGTAEYRRISSPAQTVGLVVAGSAAVLLLRRLLS